MRLDWPPRPPAAGEDLWFSEPPREAALTRLFAVNADITALQQNIHVALGLSLLEVVLGDHLVDEIVVTRQRREFLFGKFSPLASISSRRDCRGPDAIS